MDLASQVKAGFVPRLPLQVPLDLLYPLDQIKTEIKQLQLSELALDVQALSNK